MSTKASNQGLTHLGLRFIIFVVIAATLLTAATISNAASFNDTATRVDGKLECAKHTGWSQEHLETFTPYNDGCAIVCVIKGKDTSYNIRQGEPCYDSEHICYDGSCYEKGHEPKSELGTKFYVTIKIHSASVRDADPWPMQGGSDPFAVVEEISEINQRELSSNLFCHTKTIQDTNTPKWMHTCRSNPLHMKSKLRFSVYDSDKPAERPDKLGSATVTLEDIADGEAHALTLDGTPGSGTTGAYIKVSITVNNEREIIRRSSTTEPAVN